MRKRRTLLIVTAAGLAVAGAAWLSVRAPAAPVGYFTSAEGRHRFVSAYDRAMADLPRPDATLDIRTGYGIVRMYRFAGADPDRPPLVLLPGWGSASPVWADNCPPCCASAPSTPSICSASPV